MLGSGRPLDVVNIEQVVVETEDRLLGIVDHQPGVFHRLGIVFVHVVRHGGVLGHAVLLGRRDVEISLGQHGPFRAPRRTAAAYRRS